MASVGSWTCPSASMVWNTAILLGPGAGSDFARSGGPEHGHDSGIDRD
jgi:hypothetical protein